MELADLQNMWTQYDKKLTKNTRINKEVLKNILVEKPERKINWIKVKAIFNLVLPIILIPTVLIPQVSFRTDLDFIIGSGLFGIVSIVIYFWSWQYFLKILRIDFKNTITSTRKDIKELEKYKLKMTKFVYMMMPFGISGIFLMAEIPFFSMDSLLPIFLIISVMIISIYITFKFSIIEYYRKLNREIVEIEKLEM